MTTLDSLAINLDDVDRDLLATFLAPYLHLDGAVHGQIIPRPAWVEVPNEARVLLYLVARRACHALWPECDATATPGCISRATGIPGGSVRPALQRLLKARLVEKHPDQRYLVPAMALVRAQAYVAQWTEGDAA